MKKAQLLSVVFSLIMFTGLSAGTAVAYAESDNDEHDFDDRLEYFCEMTDDEQGQLFQDHPRLTDFKKQLSDYCQLDEDEREELIDKFIAEHFPNYEEHDDWDRDDILDRYCEMSPEQKAEFVEKYPMVSEHQDKMAEYCTLDESEREAYIEEHEDEYKLDHDYKKHDYDMKEILDKFCEMTPDEQAAFVEEHDKTTDDQEKIKEYCTLDESEREAYIEEHEETYKLDHDYEKHDYDMKEKMDEFCELSEEDKLAHLEEHGKSEHLAEMEEYCSLDDSSKDAFIQKQKDSMKDKISDHKNIRKDQISDHKDSMKLESKHKMVLRASTLSDEQKEEVKIMHSELRVLKQSLRDKSVSDSDKQEIRNQFMEKAKEFSITWLSPRHQVAAGIDAQMVECREGLALVMKTSNTSPLCVKETTAEKLIKRGIAITAI